MVFTLRAQRDRDSAVEGAPAMLGTTNSSSRGRAGTMSASSCPRDDGHVGSRSSGGSGAGGVGIAKRVRAGLPVGAVIARMSHHRARPARHPATRALAITGAKRLCDSASRPRARRSRREAGACPSSRSVIWSRRARSRPRASSTCRSSDHGGSTNLSGSFCRVIDLRFEGTAAFSRIFWPREKARSRRRAGQRSGAAAFSLMATPLARSNGGSMAYHRRRRPFCSSSRRRGCR